MTSRKNEVKIKVKRKDSTRNNPKEISIRRSDAAPCNI